MNNFTFYSPTYFVFGKEEENNTGKYVKRFGGSKVLIHYGGGSVVRSGLLDRIKASLTAEGIEFVELGGVKPNPRSGLVYEGIELCKKENVDFVLAVGGFYGFLNRVPGYKKAVEGIANTVSKRNLEIHHLGLSN